MNKIHKENGKRIVIGKITRPHGVKGGFKVFPLTNDPKRFSRIGNAVLVSPGGEERPCTVARVQYQSRLVILTCRGMNGLEAIQPFIGGTLEIPEGEAVDLPSDSYFQHDLVGLDVFLENGTALGEVQEILTTGGNDVLIVRNEKREYLIPALRSVVIKVDLAEGRMTIRPLEGLLDL